MILVLIIVNFTIEISLNHLIYFTHIHITKEFFNFFPKLFKSSTNILKIMISCIRFIVAIIVMTTVQFIDIASNSCCCTFWLKDLKKKRLIFLFFFFVSIYLPVMKVDFVQEKQMVDDEQLLLLLLLHLNLFHQQHVDHPHRNNP